MDVKYPSSRPLFFCLFSELQPAHCSDSASLHSAKPLNPAGRFPSIYIYIYIYIFFFFLLSHVSERKGTNFTLDEINVTVHKLF